MKWFVIFFSGEYSCLKVDLLFKREFSYYLIQIYIPCCMLVIVSWVSFWLDQGAVPARVSLGKPSFYCQKNWDSLIICRKLKTTSAFRCNHTANHGHTNIWYKRIVAASILHKSESSKSLSLQHMAIDVIIQCKKWHFRFAVSFQAIDVWTGVCLTFVFGALLEFALVNYASRSGTYLNVKPKHYIFLILLTHPLGN